MRADGVGPVRLVIVCRTGVTHIRDGFEARVEMVTYDRILLPTDGSTETSRTIDHAVSIARDDGATLHVLYVVDQRRYRAAEKDVQDDVIQSLEEEGERAIDAAAVEAEEAGVDVVTEMREGIPHKTILEYVDEADVDLVAIGTHGRTGRDRVDNLGSVSERVVQAAEVPVLVVDIGSG